MGRILKATLTDRLLGLLERHLGDIHPDVNALIADSNLCGRILTDLLDQTPVTMSNHDITTEPSHELSAGYSAISEGRLVTAMRRFSAGLRWAESGADLLWMATFNAALADVDDCFRVRGEGLAEGRALDRRRAARAFLGQVGLEQSELALSLDRIIHRDTQAPLAFLSYDSSQRQVIGDIAEELRRQSVRVVLDMVDFRGGASINDQIDHALCRATSVVVFLTRRYVRRKYCIKELMSAVERYRSGDLSPSRFVLVWLESHIHPPETGDLRLVLAAGRSAAAVASEIAVSILPSQAVLPGGTSP